VLVGSTAWNIGIRSGDVLMAANGTPLLNQYDLRAATNNTLGPVEIEYLHGPGQEYKRSVTFPQDHQHSLGVLPVYEGGYRLEINASGPLWRKIIFWWRKNKR